MKFPNPEEGKGALSLSMDAADECGANYILANDPDADRLAVAERNGYELSKLQIRVDGKNSLVA